MNNTQEIQDFKGICGKEIIKGGFGCTCLLPLNHIGECKNSPFVIDEYGNKVEPATQENATSTVCAKCGSIGFHYVCEEKMTGQEIQEWEYFETLKETLEYDNRLWLIDKLESFISQKLKEQRSDILETVRKNLDDYCIYEVSAETLLEK